MQKWIFAGGATSNSKSISSKNLSTSSAAVKGRDLPRGAISPSSLSLIMASSAIRGGEASPLDRLHSNDPEVARPRRWRLEDFTSWGASNMVTSEAGERFSSSKAPSIMASAFNPNLAIAIEKESQKTRIWDFFSYYYHTLTGTSSPPAG